MLKKSVTSLLLAICLISVSFYTPANAAAKKVTKKALSGTTWKNKVSDPTMEFSSQSSYPDRYPPRSNGKVQLRGWRNKDTGTYKIIKGKKIKATFTSLYCDFPGSGWEKVNGRYTATLTVDLSKRRLKCKFNGLTDSNAQDGYYYRR